MAHYALVDNQNIVVSVVVADQDPTSIDHLKTQAEDISGRWIQTSYNTRGNVHYNPDGTPSGQPGLRKNYAGIGFIYSDELDAFLSPKPYNSWILDETHYFWKAPIERPFIVVTDDLNDRRTYVWNEDKLSWEFDYVNKVKLIYKTLNYSSDMVSDTTPPTIRTI